MFSQVAVCPQGRGVVIPGPFWEVVGMPSPMVVGMPGLRFQSLLGKVGMPGPGVGMPGLRSLLGVVIHLEGTPLEGTPLSWKVHLSTGRYTPLLEDTRPLGRYIPRRYTLSADV